MNMKAILLKTHSLPLTLVVLTTGYWYFQCVHSTTTTTTTNSVQAQGREDKINDNNDQLRWAADNERAQVPITKSHHVKRAAISSSSSSSSTDSEFRAKCLLNREPSLTKSPEMHFFSGKSLGNSPQRGLSLKGACKAQAIGIKLNITKGETQDGDDSSSRASSQVQQIQRKLLIPNLYNKNLNTYILIHGYTDDWLNETWLCQLKDRILNEKSGQANVFILDWSGGSKPATNILDYGLATANIGLVAELASAFLINLLKLSSSPPLSTTTTTTTTIPDAQLFHLIGHSLGAHLAGFIGYHLGEGSVGRITGLDPAGPCFRSGTEQQTGRSIANVRLTGYLEAQNSTRRRLSASSARLVTALHSDTTLAGLNENCGHYDVYLNGGAQQPNCSDSLIESLFSNQVSCNHMGSHRLLFDTPTVQEEDFRSGGQTRRVKSEFSPLILPKCHAMSYECSSWEAFKAGECGECNDQDARCHFAGLYLGSPGELPDANLWQASGLGGASISLRKQREIGTFSENPDVSFNGEDDSSAPEQELDSQSDANRNLNAASISRHFLRSGIKLSVCLYQYQVIIAIRRSEKSTNTRYYLEIASRPKNRLIQVSHKVQAGIRLRAKRVIGNTYSQTTNNSTDNRDSDLSSEFDYYSALITFNSSTLAIWDAKISKTAHLYSSTTEALQNVQWVALNYLSGLSESTREMNSQLLILANREEEGVSLTSSLEREKQPTWSEEQLSRGQRSLYRSIYCLLSFGRASNCNPLNYYVTLVNAN